jgi:hypothetical protein
MRLCASKGILLLSSKTQLSIHDGIKTQYRMVSVEGHRSRNAWAVIVMERVGFASGWVWDSDGDETEIPKANNLPKVYQHCELGDASKRSHQPQ